MLLLSSARAHPGDPAARQPVHTVYGGADLFRADTARRLGDLALRTLATYAPDAAALVEVLAIDPALAPRIRDRILAKLEREPVEDFRIDFEDGFGHRPDAEEDSAAEAAGREVARGLADGTLPPFVGIRVKPFTGELASVFTPGGSAPLTTRAFHSQPTRLVPIDVDVPAGCVSRPV